MPESFVLLTKLEKKAEEPWDRVKKKCFNHSPQFFARLQKKRKEGKIPRVM